MSKKNSEQTKQPAHVQKLLKNGTVILEAKSLDELTEMVNDIPADCRYGAGAVGCNRDTGNYSLRIDLTN